jgi:hypothetical protein
LKNAPFSPISTSGGTSRQRRGSNFNPRNIQYIPVVKIFAFPRGKLGIFDLTLTKIGHFLKVSYLLLINFSFPFSIRPSGEEWLLYIMATDFATTESQPPVYSAYTQDGTGEIPIPEYHVENCP